MPLAVSFTAACARGLGLGNGEAPRVPTSVSVTAGVTTITATYTITISTFPLSRVEYRISSGADAGQYLGSLPGASGSNSSGTISTRLTTAGVSENLLHATTYTIYFRAVDASGQVGPETAGDSFTTGAEVAPTAATPSISSSSVSFPTKPSLEFTYGAGTAGTYPIGTREYSVVAGNNPGAGTYTALAGTSGTQSVTLTSGSAITAGSFSTGTQYEITSVGTTDFTLVGASSNTVGVSFRATGAGSGTGTVRPSILPGTLYTVYLRYTASSPGSATNTAHATHTTAAEITASAPTAQISSWDGTDNDQGGLGRESGRTSIVIARGNAPTPPVPTYQYKYQYAYGTSSNPTNWADFPSSGTASSVTVSSLSTDTQYYARTRAISLGPGDTAGAISANATGTTNPALPPTPTIAWRSSMTSSSYGTAQFTLGNNGGSTTAVYIVRRPTSGTDSGATSVLRATGSQDISTNLPSDGGTEYYVAYNFNRLGEASTVSATQLAWTRPAKNTYYSEKPQGTAEYVLAATNSAQAGCSPSYFGITYSSLPSSDEVPGYKRVDYYGFQIKTGSAGFSNTVSTYLYWTDPAGTKTASLAANTGATYSLRFESLGLGGSSLNGEIKINFIYVGGDTPPSGSAARFGGAPSCAPVGTSHFFAKEFYVEGVQTSFGTVS